MNELNTHSPDDEAVLKGNLAFVFLPFYCILLCFRDLEGTPFASALSMVTVQPLSVSLSNVLCFSLET